MSQEASNHPVSNFPISSISVLSTTAAAPLPNPTTTARIIMTLCSGWRLSHISGLIFHLFILAPLDLISVVREHLAAYLGCIIHIVIEEIFLRLLIVIDIHIYLH